MTHKANPFSDKCVCAMLRKASRSVTQLYDNAIRPCGLRATQFHVLAGIKATGEATVTELTRRLVIDQTTLTRGLALLERDGILEAVPKADGRIKSVRLTQKGEMAFQAALPLWASVQARMVRKIGHAAWEALSVELESLSAV